MDFFKRTNGNSTLMIESTKLRALSAVVPYVLSSFMCLVPYMFSCLTSLMLYMLLCLKCVFLYVLSCLTFLMLYLFCVSLAFVPLVLSCPSYLTYFRRIISNLLSWISSPSSNVSRLLCFGISDIWVFFQLGLPSITMIKRKTITVVLLYLISISKIH